MTMTPEECKRTAQGMIKAGLLIPPKDGPTPAEQLAHDKERKEVQREAMQRLRERRRYPFPPGCVAIPEAILDHFEDISPYERRILSAICRFSFGPRAILSVVTLHHLAQSTRMAPGAIASGLEGLTKRGWIVYRSTPLQTGYRLAEEFSKLP